MMEYFAYRGIFRWVRRCANPETETRNPDCPNFSVFLRSISHQPRREERLV